MSAPLHPPRPLGSPKHGSVDMGTVMPTSTSYMAHVRTVLAAVEDDGAQEAIRLVRQAVEPHARASESPPSKP